MIDSPSTSGALLVVEAHADTAESLQLLLETLGYVVHVALDAATALVLVDRFTFDLAFVAIGLPDVDGYALARRLRALGRPRILVALTGYGHDTDRQRATDAGFDDHLLKPATVEQLETVLARFVKSQRR